MIDLASHAAREMAAVRGGELTQCKICQATATPFDVVDFGKTCGANVYPSGLAGVPIVYHRCAECTFIFTRFFDAFSSEDFGHFIYNDEYEQVDPDFIVLRPHLNARFVEAFFAARKDRVIGLDYGGGAGLTAQLLRAKGWQYDNFDPFGATHLQPEHRGRYSVCTAFEVFEHLPDPIASLAEIAALASPERLIVVIGTHLSDHAVTDGNRLAWWYAAPRNGHISLFSAEAMHRLAATAGLTYVRPRPTLHLLARGYERGELRQLARRYVVRQGIRKILTH